MAVDARDGDLERRECCECYRLAFQPLRISMPDKRHLMQNFLHAANCGETRDLLKCSRCQSAWFCSVKCQKVGLGSILV